MHISHNLKNTKNLNLCEAIAQTVISRDELGKKKQPMRMVTRSRNSPGNFKAPSLNVSPMSIRKRDLKNRHKEKENINLNHPCKLEPSSCEKKHINSPI